MRIHLLLSLLCAQCHFNLFTFCVCEKPKWKINGIMHKVHGGRCARREWNEDDANFVIPCFHFITKEKEKKKPLTTICEVLTVQIDKENALHEFCGEKFARNMFSVLVTRDRKIMATKEGNKNCSASQYRCRYWCRLRFIIVYYWRNC